MTTVYLEPSQVPANLRGSYNGKKFRAVITDTVHIGSQGWSGGSQTTYSMVDLATGNTLPIVDTRPWPQNQSSLGERPISAGVAVVEHTTYRGRDLGLTFYIHPENAPQYLPLVSDNLTYEEKLILAAMKRYKASYRWVELERKGITRERYESEFKSDLVSAGYVTARNAITVKGRNVDISEIKFY
jgi:hypothetical protein